MDYSEPLRVSAGIDTCKTNRQGWSTKKVFAQWCLRSVIFEAFFLMLHDGSFFPYISESTAPAEGSPNPQGGQSFGKISQEKSRQLAQGQTMVSWRQVWQHRLATAAPCYQLQNAVVDVTPQTNRNLRSGAEPEPLHVAHAEEFGFWRGNLFHCAPRS